MKNTHAHERAPEGSPEQREIVAKMWDICHEIDRIAGHGPTMDIDTAERWDREGKVNEPGTADHLFSLAGALERLLKQSALPENHPDYPIFASHISFASERGWSLHTATKQMEQRRNIQRIIGDDLHDPSWSGGYTERAG